MAKKMIERYRRGFFGWIFLLIFWGWNLLMVWALLKGASATDCAQYASQAEQTGCNAGAGLGIIMVMVVWAVGSVVFGLLAYFTRGRKEIIEIES